MASNQKREETEPLLHQDDTDDNPEWDTKHAMNIVLGAGVGSFLEFYAWMLVSYFSDELKGYNFLPLFIVYSTCTLNNQYGLHSEYLSFEKDAFFPATTGEYASLMDYFILYGIAFVVRPFGVKILVNSVHCTGLL